jgi:excisionase family DNA binding protein
LQQMLSLPDLTAASYTTRQAAEILGTSVRGVRQLAKEGKLRVVAAGSRGRGHSTHYDAASVESLRRREHDG